MKIIPVDDFPNLLRDGSRLMIGGFGCCGSPDSLIMRIRKHFLNTGSPKGISIQFVSGVGNKDGKGLDYIAIDGLLKEAIGGYWGFTPVLAEMAISGRIIGHNWPIGVMCKLLSLATFGINHFKSNVGIRSFVDPTLTGGVISPLGKTLLSIKNEEISYPWIPPNVSIFKGSASDIDGNISMASEYSRYSSAELCLATKKSGGIVVAQVGRLNKKINASDLHIPGSLIDFVVVVDDSESLLSSYGRITSQKQPEEHDYRKLIAEETVSFLKERKLLEKSRSLNFGIGIPAIVGNMLGNMGGHCFLQ